MSPTAARRLTVFFLSLEMTVLLLVGSQILAEKYGVQPKNYVAPILWASLGFIPLGLLWAAGRFARPRATSRVAAQVGPPLSFLLVAGQWVLLLIQPHIGVDIVVVIRWSSLLLLPMTFALSWIAIRIAVSPAGGTISSQRLRPSSNGYTIVFIHGILSGRRAWENPTTNAFWPELVLVEPELSAYGVYVFNYRADAFSGAYSIDDAVRKLTEDIRDIFPQERGFVFVGHSMGGIVARTFVVDRVVDLLRRQTKVGTFLVASPSGGSNYANIISFLIAFISPFYNSQLKTLRSGQTNEWLMSIDRRFIEAIHDGHLDISGTELIEDNPKPWMALLQRAQVVPPISAARYFPNPLRIEHSDHASIAKPADKEAQQHRALRRFLREFLQQKSNAARHGS
jgi:pimeloyl-ACP methyl ester carboxylesterase